MIFYQLLLLLWLLLLLRQPPRLFRSKLKRNFSFLAETANRKQQGLDALTGRAPAANVIEQEQEPEQKQEQKLGISDRQADINVR